MPVIQVKVKYSASGGTPSATITLQVSVNSNPPIESEVYAAIKKTHPKWNFIIIGIK